MLFCPIPLLKLVVLVVGVGALWKCAVQYRCAVAFVQLFGFFFLIKHECVVYSRRHQLELIEKKRAEH